jgi:multidrug efflux pump
VREVKRREERQRRARNSIGIMLVTGMIIGTCFTLFVVPSIYVLVAKRHTAEVREEAGELEPVTA